MKKVKVLVAALSLVVLSVNSIQASENKVAVSNNQSVAEEIKRIFYSSPTEDLMNEGTENLTIHFRITQNHEFELVKIDGENHELVRYSTIVLSNRKVKVDSSVEPKEYELPVKFINQ